MFCYDQASPTWLETLQQTSPRESLRSNGHQSRCQWSRGVMTWGATTGSNGPTIKHR